MNDIKKVIDTVSKFATVAADNNAERAEVHRLNQAVSILEAIEEHEAFQERLKVTDAIWAYYATSKQAGHSELMRQGINEYDKPFIVVIGAEIQKETFAGFKTVHYSKLADVAGTGYPLAWDNMALVRVFSSLSIIEGAFRKIREILR